MREFNTSGPNIPSQHYTIERTDLIAKGIKLVEKELYFTLWAPRQTGKSTYFRQLADELEKQDYKVAHIDCEKTDKTKLLYEVLNKLDYKFEKVGNVSTHKFANIIERIPYKIFIIWDNIDHVETDFLVQLLLTLRSLYHSREMHNLKSVIISGVENIFHVVLENTDHSVFNVADDMNFPYFTDKEVFELLGQHETETGQIFEQKVKQKISEITANQPGLVNGFAKKLVDDYPDKKTLTYDDYLKVEDWYLNEAIDKNFSNILNKAKEERAFVERLLFIDMQIPFMIDRPAIKRLHTNGLIKKDENGYVAFWVPFYKKRLYDAFYPYTNGEKKEINLTFLSTDFYDKNNKFTIQKLVENYKIYVKRSGFKPFLEKDEQGNYKSIKESALIYSFETFITAIIQEMEGKIYREANTGLGKSDMIINIDNAEFLIETKIYASPKSFDTGKKQLAYYAQSLNLKEAVYLVFLPKRARTPETVKEQTENIENIEISTYLIEYDETKW